MRKMRSSLQVIILIASMLVAALALVLVANLQPANKLPRSLARVPFAGIPTAQVTIDLPVPEPSVYVPPAVPSAAAVVRTATPSVACTEPQPDDTSHPTAVMIALPSVVAEGTFAPIRPPPDPTDVAIATLRHFLIEQLYYSDATPVAQGSNATPITDPIYPNLTLTTYSVKKVTFPEEMTWETWVPSAQEPRLELRPVTFREAWRVTVKGSGFIVGANSWMIYAGDQVLGYSDFADGGQTTIVYDRSLLVEGAKLGVSYGYHGLTYLPEALHLPADTK